MTSSIIKHKQDDDDNIALYSSLLREHGNCFKSLNWGSKTSQELRFKILSEIGLKPEDSVLDVGCGLGDLYHWFNSKGFSIEYSGIDITADMIKFASERFPDISFIEGSGCNLFVKQKKNFDFVLASGIFTHRQKKPLEFFQDTIKDMYKISNKGIAFNCLSSWHDNKESNEFYADPAETLSFCQSLSNRIVLRHDYHQGDFTMYLYKSYTEN